MTTPSAPDIPSNTEPHDEQTVAPGNRRSFLRNAGATVAVAGAGLAGAAALGGTDAAAATPREHVTVPEQAKQPLVAYVRDAHSGEVAIHVGERQVVVNDPELAARIARAAY